MADFKVTFASGAEVSADFGEIQTLKGDPGLSAYEIAIENGFEGTEAEWLESLQGKDGKDGYTPIKGVDYFDGKDGVDGKDGKDGVDGKTPVKGTDYYTETDKAEMVSAIIAQLPVYDGEVVSI